MQFAKVGLPLENVDIKQVDLPFLEKIVGP